MLKTINVMARIFAISLSLVFVIASGCSTEDMNSLDIPERDDNPGQSQTVSYFETSTSSFHYCNGDDLQEIPTSGTRKVGDFSLQYGVNAALAITNVQNPTRVLFSTPEGSPALEIAQSDFFAEEHQGSFGVEENIGLTCSSPRLGGALSNGDTLVLQGGFSDSSPACADLEFQITFCQVQEGHLSFEVVTSNPSFNMIALRDTSNSTERIYGMGEQFPHDTLNLKGRSIPVLAQEGGVGRGHAPLSFAVNLVSKGSAGSEETSYYPMPHFLTNTNRSFMLENTEYGVFDFEPEDQIVIRLFNSSMLGRVLYGESPLELIERFTEYTGRMPPLPEWVNQGAIVALARPLDRSLQIVDRLRAHGAEIAAVWNQTWSGVSKTFVGEQVLWNWVQNPNAHPGWNQFVDNLQARDIRTLCYVNSMFRDVPEKSKPVRRNLFKEGFTNDYFVRDEAGNVYMMPITAFEVGLLDLTNPEAREWMKDIIKEEMIDAAGCSGWMADFAEALPFDAVLYSGESAASYHNQYPVEWAKLNREAVAEAGRLGDILFFNRSGHTRSPAYSVLNWQGDQLTTWDKYDGLTSALRSLISGGLSGISLNHSDVGGYTAISAQGAGYNRESEQLKRWTEMNAFTTALRTHEGNNVEDNAQVYSDDAAMEHFARFTKVYQSLAFYRSQLFEEASTKGWPVVRHLMLHYPNDPEAHQIDDQFLLGSEILVAPIKNRCWQWHKCSYEKKVYLPEGQWVHLWSGQVYGNRQQGTWQKVKAPIGKPAVFYRLGSEVGLTFVENLREHGISAGTPR